jgi:hypothetical protein
MTIGEFRLALVAEIRALGFRQTWATNVAKATLLQGYAQGVRLDRFWKAHTRIVRGGIGVATVRHNPAHDMPSSDDETVFPRTTDGARRAAKFVVRAQG